MWLRTWGTLYYCSIAFVGEFKDQTDWYRFQPQHKLLAGHIGYRINMAFLSPLAHVCFTEAAVGSPLLSAWTWVDVLRFTNEVWKVYSYRDDEAASREVCFMKERRSHASWIANYWRHPHAAVLHSSKLLSSPSFGMGSQIFLNHVLRRLHFGREHVRENCLVLWWLRRLVPRAHSGCKHCQAVSEVRLDDTNPVSLTPT